MTINKDLAFCGTNFNRADHLRKDTTALKAKKATSMSCLFWRGKPLIDLSTDTLVFLKHDHPILKLSKSEPIFLGTEEDIHFYAYDISSWEPSDLDSDQMQQFLDGSHNHHPLLGDQQVFVDLRAFMTKLDLKSAELASTAKALFSWHRSHQFCSTCGHPSDISNSGWQRNCPACATPHFPRTDPVVIMLVVHGNETLLGRAHNWPEKMYSCLAGFVEPGETIEAAVAREVLEETAVEIEDVQYEASQPWAFPNSLMIGCICKAKTKEIRIDDKELEDAIWVSKETLMKSLSGLDVGIEPARSGAIASFLIRKWLKGYIHV